VTSNINYLSINENFPVAGEDNDTQTFRDNFDTIKTSLRAGQEEITALQANTAKLNTDNDFEDNEISRAVLVDVMDKRFDGGMISVETALLTVDFENGSYQVFRFSANMNIDFQNLPENSSASGPIGCGRITLELYGDGSPRVLTFIASAGTTFRRNSSPSWTTITVTSSTAPVILEIWRHNATNIFMNNLGQFS
jgi:hypothetical protein